MSIKATKWIESGENIHVIWNTYQSIIKKLLSSFNFSKYFFFHFYLFIWLFYLLCFGVRGLLHFPFEFIDFLDHEITT